MTQLAKFADDAGWQSRSASGVIFTTGDAAIDKAATQRWCKQHQQGRHMPMSGAKPSRAAIQWFAAWAARTQPRR